MIAPKPALVIGYSYLWHREHVTGQEEGRKTRPCAIVMTVQNTDGRDVVTLLPITHSPPREADDAVELPPETKRRLGLDDARSWVVVTEANRFDWPGPDLHPRIRGDEASVAYGTLPPKLFERIRLALLRNIRRGRVPLVMRTE